jgi:AraC-like DNA-binding protein
MRNNVTAAPDLGVPALLDLEAIDEPQRAALWSKTARSYFPGISVRELRASPTIGVMQGLPFGSGHLWTVLSPPLQAAYEPPASDALRSLFSVMLQLKESTLASQSRHSCLLKPGNICLVDNRLPFTLEVTNGYSQFMLLQLPRDAVLGRHPYLERQTAEAFDPEESGAMMIRQILLSILESAPLLENEQRAMTLAAVIQLLGVPKQRHSSEVAEINWRARAALAYIDARLADHELTAGRVSRTQGISRRRLDEIMVNSVGTSLTAQIWIRRLTQAASDLRDPRLAAKSVSEIAFAAGFVDAAHFTRAFKRRYAYSPRVWRSRGLGSGVNSDAVSGASKREADHSCSLV